MKCLVSINNNTINDTHCQHENSLAKKQVAATVLLNKSVSRFAKQPVSRNNNIIADTKRQHKITTFNIAKNMLEKSNLIKDISKTTNLNVEDIIDLK